MSQYEKDLHLTYNNIPLIEDEQPSLKDLYGIDDDDKKHVPVVYPPKKDNIPVVHPFVPLTKRQLNGLPEKSSIAQQTKILKGDTQEEPVPEDALFHLFSPVFAAAALQQKLSDSLRKRFNHFRETHF